MLAPTALAPRDPAGRSFGSRPARGGGQQQGSAPGHATSAEAVLCSLTAPQRQPEFAAGRTGEPNESSMNGAGGAALVPSGVTLACKYFLRPRPCTAVREAGYVQPRRHQALPEGGNRGGGELRAAAPAHPQVNKASGNPPGVTPAPRVQPAGHLLPTPLCARPWRHRPELLPQQVSGRPKSTQRGRRTVLASKGTPRHALATSRPAHVKPSSH